jgi:hypothetical protein
MASIVRSVAPDRNACWLGEDSTLPLRLSPPAHGERSGHRRTSVTGMRGDASGVDPRLPGRWLEQRPVRWRPGRGLCPRRPGVRRSIPEGAGAPPAPDRGWPDGARLPHPGASAPLAGRVSGAGRFSPTSRQLRVPRGKKSPWTWIEHRVARTLLCSRGGCSVAADRMNHTRHPEEGAMGVRRRAMLLGALTMGLGDPRWTGAASSVKSNVIVQRSPT